MSCKYLKFFNVLHFTGDRTLINKMLKKISYRKIPFTFDPNKVLTTPRELRDVCDFNIGQRDTVYAYLTIASPYTDITQYPKIYSQIEKYDEETYNRVCQALFSTSVFSKTELDAFGKNNPSWLNLHYKKSYKEVLRGRACVESVLKHGITTLWDWRKEHWGADWCGHTPIPTRTDNTLIFRSTKGNIRPLVRMLSKKFPDVKIEYLWADDKFSHDCGECMYFKGEETCIATEISDNKPITNEIVYEIKYDYLKGYTVIEYNDYAEDYILRNEEHPYSAFYSEVHLYQLMQRNNGLVNYDGHEYNYNKILP